MRERVSCCNTLGNIKRTVVVTSMSLFCEVHHRFVAERGGAGSSDGSGPILMAASRHKDQRRTPWFWHCLRRFQNLEKQKSLRLGGGLHLQSPTRSIGHFVVANTHLAFLKDRPSAFFYACDLQIGEAQKCYNQRFDSLFREMVVFENHLKFLVQPYTKYPKNW